MSAEIVHQKKERETGWREKGGRFFCALEVAAPSQTISFFPSEILPVEWKNRRKNVFEIKIAYAMAKSCTIYV